MKIEVWQSQRSGGWYWHIVARNGRLVADSEEYRNRADAIRAAKAFVRGMVKPLANSLKPIVFTPLFHMRVDKQGVTTIRWY